MKTNPNNFFLLLALIAGLGLMLTGRGTAQTFTSLHSFTRYVDGVSLQAGVVLSGNTLYGTTEYGGPSGNNSTLFAVNTNGSGFRLVYNFPAEANNSLGFPTNSGAGGSDGTLVLSGNTLYGASYDGGTNGTGAVFAVNTNGTFTLLYSLNAAKTNPVTGLFTNSDGYGSEAGLILSGSTLYGTTEHGGTSGYGVVFKVNTNGTGFVTLHNFTNGTDGSVPHTLVLSGSTLYGTTLGFSGNGTVFALGTNGLGFTTLHTFTATNFIFPQGGAPPGPGYTNSDGVGPSGLSLSGNTLYGTAFWGGSNGCGTVFALNTNGTGFTTLHSFAAGRTNSSGVYTNGEGLGTLAFTGLVLSSNILYGAAYYGGGAGNGTVFSLTTNGTGFTTLYNFSATNVSGGNNDGANPYAGLTLSRNTLYGTTKYGGTSGNGTVFSIYLGLVVTTTSLPNGTNGLAYSQTLTATGGQKPYTWINISGALPPGLNLATNGVISGTPTNSGAFNFTVKVTDAASNTTTQQVAITVVSLQVTTVTLPNGTNGFAYSQQLTAINGQSPFSWSLLSGSLPPGLLLATNGVLYGTPIGSGIFNFTVKVTDAFSLSATQPLALTLMGPPVVTIQPTNNFIWIPMGSNTIFSALVSGPSPFNYQWQLNGTNLPDGIITTVAGNGIAGFAGDGGAATNAELFWPRGVAVDAIGNLFIADEYNNRIRKVDTNGIITTVAGYYWSPGFTGDGGAATNAELYDPYGVAVDAIGDFYILGGLRVREVGTNGIINTLAGNGTEGFIGDRGAATNAEFFSPYGLTVDAAGNIFIADTFNQSIRKVGTNGIINTVAGGGMNYPGDGGAATNAELSYPQGVAADSIGNFFIADTSDWRIRKVDTNGIITTVAGTGVSGNTGDGGVATNANLNPVGVAVDNIGRLFIIDPLDSVIREVGTNGIITTAAGNGQYGHSGDGGPAIGAELKNPSGVAVDATGTLYIADKDDQCVRKVFNLGFSTSPVLLLKSVSAVNAGVYRVIVSNAFGSTTSSVVSLNIAGPFQYTASQANGLAPLTVQFTSPGVDSGGNVISSWNWIFGDGTISTYQSPLHVYTSAGNFKPSLVATNSYGSPIIASGPAIQVRICAVSAPQGLVSWWSGDGNAVDSIGGNNGIVQGGLVYTNGMVGQALSFDGTSAYLNTSQMISNPQNFTMAMWFKTTTTQGGLLLGFDSSQTGNSSTYDRHLYMDSAGLLHFGTYTTGFQVISSSTSYNDGGWHCVVAISSTNSGASLYVDGQLLANNPAYKFGFVYNGYWRIGENTLTSWPSAPNSYYFAGALDELMLFDRPLTSSEIQALYQAGTNGMCPPTPLMFTGVPSYNRASGVVLNASLRSGQSYHLQSNTNLASTNWITLTNFVAGTAPISHLTNQPPTNAPQGFYRLVSP